MRTISYFFVKESNGELCGTVSCRGALCYTGRILLEDFTSKEKINRLLASGPIDMIGHFEDEVDGMTNPAIIRKASYEQQTRLPDAFRSGAVKFSSIEEFKKANKNHVHYGSVDYFVFENNQWYYAKHNIDKLQKLTTNSLNFDDEDNG